MFLGISRGAELHSRRMYRISLGYLYIIAHRKRMLRHVKIKGVAKWRRFRTIFSVCSIYIPHHDDIHISRFVVIRFKLRDFVLAKHAAEGRTM